MALDDASASVLPSFPFFSSLIPHRHSSSHLCIRSIAYHYPRRYGQRRIRLSITTSAHRTPAARVSSGAMPPTRSQHSSLSPPKHHRSSANTPGNQSTAPSSSAKISQAGTAASASATSDAPGKIKSAKNNEDQPKSAALPSTGSSTTPRRFSLACGFGFSPPSSLWLKYYPSHRGIAGEADVVCYPAEDSLPGEWHFENETLPETPTLATWHLRVIVKADDTRTLKILRAPEGTEMHLRPFDEGAAAAGGANVSLQTPEGFKVRFDLWREKMKRDSIEEEVDGQGGSSGKKVKVEE